MVTTLFTADWLFHRDDAAPVPVRLPHDAMIGEPRSAADGTGNHGGYFPGGCYRYTKEWSVPDDAATRWYSLFFEGVYGAAIVSVDGAEVTRCDSGYRAFAAPLTGLVPGETVTIQVDVDNSAVPNSRWYTGSGIYRQVWLESTAATRFARDGIRLVTRELAPSAVIDVDVTLEGPVDGHRVRVEVADGHAVVAAGDLAIIGRTAAGDLGIPGARAWSADDPHLYTVTARLLDPVGAVVDERVIRTGLRTVTVDPAEGLRINGQEVKLRGACVHHDNGVLGAATIPEAERRRARLLKDVGFNAIRSSHHPLSRAFLDACDEIGLYVLDELTDVWFQHKTAHDAADRFEESWRDDARAMVAEDRNRPSVIMYSLGNEIAETAAPAGVDATGRLNAYVHDLDPTRPTTLAVNLMLNMMAARGKSPFEGEHYAGDAPSDAPEKPKATSTAANAAAASLGKIMQTMSRLPAADKASRDAFAQVDVAGYNYAFSRYRADRRRYPERVILGSESMPGDLPAIWRLVESVPGVIGDFLWTGWDYLGEAGIGVWAYGDEFGGINKPFPALLAGPGAIDITGLPGAPAMLARAVWGRLDAPAIAVRPLDRVGQKPRKTPWRTTDAIASWSWRGLAGKAEIEVYSDDDEVELLLNGRSLGRRRAGAKVGFITRFATVYEPGELVAVGYRAGRETGRSSLVSVVGVQLIVRAESDVVAGPDGLAYVWVELADAAATVDTAASDTVTISVDGPGELAGFGSAAPLTTESFTGDTHTTWYGRALAIVRGTTAPGEITVTATSRRHGTATYTLTNVAAAALTADSLTRRAP